MSSVCYFDTKYNETLCRCALTDISELKNLKNKHQLLKQISEQKRLQMQLQENVFLLEGQASRKGISIYLEVDDNETVFCDRNMINTIIRNILTNAIKFTNHNGKVNISVKKKYNEYEIEIRDTGVGISAKNLKRLFRIDSKFQTYGTDAEKGTGLGLIICKEFIEKHGGKIWGESELGKGSSFIFTLQM